MTPLLQVIELRKHFPVRGGPLRRIVGSVKAVDGVSFTLDAGRTFGLVGESGCGKSTLGRAILQLLRPTSGRVLLSGEDMTTLPPAALLARRREMQIVFQDPFASLSPRRTVGQTIREPLDVHRVGSRAERDRRVGELLDSVGLNPGLADRYPHQFSGGQRQRIGIARALALKPRLIVADEPVSSLDVSVRAQVLNLMLGLQRKHGIALLFISHDLSVVEHVSDDVGVMYLGRLVEQAPARDVYAAPKHPYTEALLSAVPVPDPGRRRRRIALPGEVPSARNPPPGCPFHPRCPRAVALCSQVEPPIVNAGTADRPHRVACHLYG